ncbi:MAG TPA: thiocillin family RiPP [Blastocatellia bacterium]|nr:thiocillin family RiPP [Blastocatellia bacterium]
MNYATQNQPDARDLNSKISDNAHQTSEVLELFAEELPAQHDLKMSYYTAGTLSTYGSTVSSVSTLSTI